MKIAISVRESIYVKGGCVKVIHADSFQILDSLYVIEWKDENGHGLIPIRNISGICYFNHPIEIGQSIINPK